MIPNDNLRDAFGARVLPERFRALGVIDLSSQMGKNWIIQPISIHGLNAVEKAQFGRMNPFPYTQKRTVTIIGRDEKAREISAPMIGGHADSKLLFARIQIEVETRK